MGTSWSRWLEGDGAFDKSQFTDAQAQRLFYTPLKIAVAAIERSTAQALALEADATFEGDDLTRTQLQYVLENWAREVGALYDRVGDFPLILPMPSELHTSVESEMPTPAENEPMSRDELLLKATSHDKLATSDRLYEALYRIAKSRPQEEFLRLVAQYPRATRLFVSQAIQAQTNAEAPFRLWSSTGKYDKAASHVGKLAYGEESFVKKMGRLQEMATLLQRAQKAPTATLHDRMNASFQRVMTEEMIELLDMQNRLENHLGVIHLVGSSVIETIEKLLTLFPSVPSALASAVTVGQDFRIPPKQFWWCLIKILGSNNQWHTLFVLVAAVPPPKNGYISIAEALVDARRLELASDLLTYIPSPQDREAVVNHLASQSSPPEEEMTAQAYGYAEDLEPPVLV